MKKLICVFILFIIGIFPVWADTISTDKSGFDKIYNVVDDAVVEPEFKDGDILNPALKKTVLPWQIDDLKEQHEYFKGVYEAAWSLPGTEQCEKYIDELGISETDAIKTIKELILPLLNKGEED